MVDKDVDFVRIGLICMIGLYDWIEYSESKDLEILAPRIMKVWIRPCFMMM
jgi:hypothetical protein